MRRDLGAINKTGVKMQRCHTTRNLICQGLGSPKVAEIEVALALSPL